jgi:hypothetical protein
MFRDATTVTFGFRRERGSCCDVAVADTGLRVCRLCSIRRSMHVATGHACSRGCWFRLRFFRVFAVRRVDTASAFITTQGILSGAPGRSRTADRRLPDLAIRRSAVAGAPT